MDSRGKNDITNDEKNKYITSDLWKDLYDIVDVIKKDEPWKFFSAADPAEIFMEGVTEPYYCSIQGMFNSERSFSIYEGYAGLVSFSTYINSFDVPEIIADSKKNCLMCRWVPYEELETGDVLIMEDIGIEIYKKKEYPAFRKLEAGYAPWSFNNDDILLFSDILKIFKKSFDFLYSNGSINEMEKGERICAGYDVSKKNRQYFLLPPVEKINVISNSYPIEDELLIRRLLKKSRNGMTLEFDIFYLPVPMEGKKNEERPMYPKIAMLCNSYKFEVVSRRFVDRRELSHDMVVEIIADYIKENGRPSEILVRDVEIAGLISSLCKAADIDVRLESSLKALDFYTQDIIKLMSRKE